MGSLDSDGIALSVTFFENISMGKFRIVISPEKNFCDIPITIYSEFLVKWFVKQCRFLMPVQDTIRYLILMVGENIELLIFGNVIQKLQRCSR